MITIVNLSHIRLTCCLDVLFLSPVVLHIDKSLRDEVVQVHILKHFPTVRCKALPPSIRVHIHHRVLNAIVAEVNILKSFAAMDCKALSPSSRVLTDGVLQGGFGKVNALKPIATVDFDALPSSIRQVGLS